MAKYKINSRKKQLKVGVFLNMGLNASSKVSSDGFLFNYFFKGEESSQRVDTRKVRLSTVLKSGLIDFPL